jgi:hypothetical protein
VEPGNPVAHCSGEGPSVEFLNKRIDYRKMAGGSLYTS